MTYTNSVLQARGGRSDVLPDGAAVKGKPSNDQGVWGGSHADTLLPGEVWPDLINAI